MKTQFDTRTWARWLGSFIGFPIAGYVATAVVGPVDGVSAAIGGGLIAGAGLGAVQAFVRPARRQDRARWIAASALGLSGGLAAGAAAVGYRTDVASLVLMGALSGAGIGVAQAAVMPTERSRRIAWALASPALWALGWLITANVIVDAEEQFVLFGASGAIAVAALSGILIAGRPSAAPVTAIAVAP